MVGWLFVHWVIGFHKINQSSLFLSAYVITKRKEGMDALNAKDRPGLQDLRRKESRLQKQKQLERKRKRMNE